MKVKRSLRLFHEEDDEAQGQPPNPDEGQNLFEDDEGQGLSHEDDEDHRLSNDHNEGQELLEAL